MGIILPVSIVNTWLAFKIYLRGAPSPLDSGFRLLNTALMPVAALLFMFGIFLVPLVQILWLLMLSAIVGVAMAGFAFFSRAASDSPSEVVEEILSSEVQLVDKTVLRTVVAITLPFMVFAVPPAIPLEKLEPIGPHAFTGYVIGTENESLLVVAAGNRPRLIRIPAESTRREICLPQKVNFRPGMWGSFQLERFGYKRTLGQMVVRMDPPLFPACPVRNQPED
jgi:hypothetical protein